MEMKRNHPPLFRAHQLCHELDGCDFDSPFAVPLPGQPTVFINDFVRVTDFLEREFCSPDLEAIASRLWILSTQSSANINALHRQRVKGRDIVITEEVRLHLVWIRNRIFVKPLPKYLLSHEFWERFLSAKSSQADDHSETIRKAVLGFLRTYRYLIQYESDFMIAQQDHLRLIPQTVEWADFCQFTLELDQIKDSDVSGRYCYGELRLSRLNMYAPFLLRKFQFEQVHGQYGEFFERFYAPMLFVFAVFSTLLNSMQVGLAVEQVSSEHWVALRTVSRWFSAISLVGIFFIASFFAMLWLWMVVDEWIFVIRCRARKRKERSQGGCC